jgi:hypothetical protein
MLSLIFAILLAGWMTMDGLSPSSIFVKVAILQVQTVMSG